METRTYLLHALSPLHAGTGQSVGVIDLPIARQRATGMPFVPGSSVKGVLREACDTTGDILATIFGPQRDQPGPAGDHEGIDHAGALMVGDARLLALPVRSFFGTYALVTSPLLLHLARRDLVAAGVRDVPEVPADEPGSWIYVSRDPIIAQRQTRGKQDRVYLQDIALDVRESGVADSWAECLGKALPADECVIMQRRLAVVDDDTMNFLWETGTQVDTRVRIDHATHVVEGGALWTEESLPPETLLIGLMAAHHSGRPRTSLAASAILDHVLGTCRYLRFGGKLTTGKGRCVLSAWGQK